MEQLLKEFKDVTGIPPKLTLHRIELDTITPSAHQAKYKLNPNYVIAIKQDINKLLVVGFIESIEEATWLSPIIVITKKMASCIDFRILNVTTKKDPYPLPFTNEVLNIVVGYEAYFLKWIFMISSNIYSSKGQIQDCICYKLRGFYMEGDAV
jgi:hypothetical protein